ncbi:MAG: PorV/PorQ family protein [Candidatus Poribacteria bacterium]|nr:PorV/PorQ family protein [Candidatus Poribacteria bacterium]
MRKQIYKFSGFKCFFNRSEYLLIIMCFLLILCMSQQLYAEEANSSFLGIDVDARGNAMGGAQGTITGNIYSVYWNPAGLSEVLFNEVGATYNRMFQDINYSFIGYAMPSDFYGTLAFQVCYLGSGPIISTYESLDGSFAGEGDSFSVTDISFGVSQSKVITENLAYGVNIKFISHKIMDKNAFDLAGDAGVIYQPPVKGVKFGFVFRNLSTVYSFMNSKFREPWNLKFASSYELSDIPLTLAGDYNVIAEQKDTLNIGAEYWIFDIVALRTGMRLPSPNGFLSSLSVGIGFNLLDLYQLDYSFSPHSALGITQRFSLIVRF